MGIAIGRLITNSHSHDTDSKAHGQDLEVTKPHLISIGKEDTHYMDEGLAGCVATVEEAGEKHSKLSPKRKTYLTSGHFIFFFS